MSTTIISAYNSSNDTRGANYAVLDVNNTIIEFGTLYQKYGSIFAPRNSIKDIKASATMKIKRNSQIPWLIAQLGPHNNRAELINAISTTLAKN